METTFVSFSLFYCIQTRSTRLPEVCKELDEFALKHGTGCSVLKLKQNWDHRLAHCKILGGVVHSV